MIRSTGNNCASSTRASPKSGRAMQLLSTSDTAYAPNGSASISSVPETQGAHWHLDDKQGRTYCNDVYARTSVIPMSTFQNILRDQDTPSLAHHNVDRSSRFLPFAFPGDAAHCFSFSTPITSQPMHHLPKHVMPPQVFLSRPTAPMNAKAHEPTTGSTGKEIAAASNVSMSDRKQWTPSRLEDNTTYQSKLPFCLSSPLDQMSLAPFQVYLRLHIEVFAATPEDIYGHTRGRNRRVRLHQVGLRCRHCALVPPSKRGKGSSYFPSSTLGIYQAAQNMSSVHLQCGLCPEMPDSIKTVFAKLLCTKMPGSSSKSGGRKHWSRLALCRGLVDTSEGIFPCHLVEAERKVSQRHNPSTGKHPK